MSTPIFQETSALRCWSQREILTREYVVDFLSDIIITRLNKINSAWTFNRIETPVLIPTSLVNDAYTDKDVFFTNDFALRPETTAGSYLYAQKCIDEGLEKLPFCIWQSGQSFRRELSDGASPSKMRYNAFYQLEFQCLYSGTSQANYQEMIMPLLVEAIGYLTGCPTHQEDSDRLPNYSEKTLDIISNNKEGRNFELMSCSIRKDFHHKKIDNVKVLEIAFGLDRIVEFMSLYRDNL